MEEFIEKNWVALISLLVALIGGAPGIIAIINHFRNRIVFDFKIEGITIGGINNKAVILLTGTITNAGNKPLRPDTYNLEVKIDKKWFKLDKTVIPKKSILNSDSQKISIENLYENDLLKIDQSIISSSPVRGHLMFTTNKISLAKLRDEEYTLKLICFDIFNKKFQTKFPRPQYNPNQPIKFPRHGMSVQPK